MTDCNLSHCSGKSLQQWLSYLETIHSTEIDLGLTRLQNVAKRLNIDVSTDFDFAEVITVAGTNGKGTTCAFLENFLLAEQKTVAVYSSPHIEKFNERLRVNKKDIADQPLIDAFEKIEKGRGDISLTYYEYTTLAAFIILMEVKPDIIILEVGLGGRLDATNVINADIAVITTIDLDHQSFLGNDRETIGFEKAGILRTNSPSVLGDTRPAASILAHAKAINSLLAVRGKDFFITEDTFDVTGSTALASKTAETQGSIHKGYWQWHSKETIISQLKPTYIPKDNVATALMVLSLLNISLTRDKVNDIIDLTRVEGRTELFKHHCDVLLDVAHNPQAARYLSSYLTDLKRQKNYGKVVAVVGMLIDKDIENALKAIDGNVDYWYIGQPDTYRAASSSVVKTKLLKNSAKKADDFNCFDNVTQAFTMACKSTKESDLIVVFGSFYTVAEIRRLFV
jgi:dihydrofolate synthase/folylpolyglutamate synthase